MQNATTTIVPKEAALSLISRLDDHASYDDIIYEMYVLQTTEQGEKDIAEEKTFTHEKAQETIRQVVEVVWSEMP